MHLTASGSYWYSKAKQQLYQNDDIYIVNIYQVCGIHTKLIHTNIDCLTQLILIFTLKHMPWTCSQNLWLMKIYHSPILQVIPKPSRKKILIELISKNDRNFFRSLVTFDNRIIPDFGKTVWFPAEYVYF